MAWSELLWRVEPYVFVETHAEGLFWKYIRTDRDAIQSIVIVGAWQGLEIRGLLQRYPAAHIVAFEPSPHDFPALKAAYVGSKRVSCFQLAIADHTGEIEFHAGSLPGTGSLLAFAGDAESQAHNLGLVETEAFRVPVTTLDDHDATRDLKHVDLLKIDVQGAEASVIRGGRRLIGRTSAVLVEVSLRGSAYADAATFQEVDAGLRQAGLSLCALGLDPITLDGNALYVRIAQRG
jgi:FkbM family methyltransferase